VWSSFPRRVAAALGLWAAWYGAYRLYYGLGGKIGMIGRPASEAQFRRINLIGAAIILLAALLPPIAMRARRWRGVFVVVGWIAAVGCCVHALTDVTQDALSLTGLHPIHYPAGLWLSIDRREAALQDGLFNEPWFFVEGCLWGVLALSCLRPPSRWPWLRSTVVAGAFAYAFGVLTALGAAPSFRYG
jgi:hypothetical protein